MSRLFQSLVTFLLILAIIVGWVAWGVFRVNSPLDGAELQTIAQKGDSEAPKRQPVTSAISDYPVAANLEISTGHDRRRMYLDDSIFVLALHSLLPGLEAGEEPKVNMREYTIIRFSYSDRSRNRAALLTGTGEGYAWLHGAKHVKLGMELQYIIDMISVMKIVQPDRRHINQMAASWEDDLKVSDCDQLFSQYHDNYVRATLRASLSKSDLLQRIIDRALMYLMLHGTYADLPAGYNFVFHPLARPGKIAPTSHATRIEVREWAIDRLVKVGHSSQRDFEKLIALLADQATIDQLAEKLRAIPDTSDQTLWYRCLQLYYGLPERYEQGSICGNAAQDPDIRQRFCKEELSRAIRARAEILAWHDAHRKNSRRDQLAAAIEDWCVNGPLPPNVYTHSCDYVRSTIRHYEPLLLLGPQLIPTLEQSQSESPQDLHKRGYLELVRAIITGSSDAKLLEELWQGNDFMRQIACDILIATNNSSYTEQLKRIIEGPYEGEALGVLQLKACEAMARVYGLEALPYWRQLKDIHKGHHFTYDALRYYDVPSP